MDFEFTRCEMAGFEFDGLEFEWAEGNKCHVPEKRLGNWPQLWIYRQIITQTGDNARKECNC